MTPSRWVLGGGGVLLLATAILLFREKSSPKVIINQSTSVLSPSEQIPSESQVSSPLEGKEHVVRRPTVASRRGAIPANGFVRSSPNPLEAKGGVPSPGARADLPVLARTQQEPQGAAPSQSAAPQGDAFESPPSVDEIAEDGHEHRSHYGDWKPPLSWDCSGDRAYIARKVTIVDTASAALKKALQEASGKSGGITLAIQRKGEDFITALSASEKSGAGAEQFPADRAPEWVRLIDGSGQPPGVSTERFQPRGYLRVGTTWLELSNLNWRAVEDGGCDQVNVNVYASLKESQLDQSLQRGNDSVKIRDLVGPEWLQPAPVHEGISPRRQPNTKPVPLPLHFQFQAVSVPFSSADPR